MSLDQSPGLKFSTVFDKSEYHALEAVVKVQHVAKGNNIIFGRTLKDGDLGNLIYIGKVLESSTGKNYLSSDAWLDTSYPHVIYITGTRGSGKSFDLGVLIEGIANLATSSPIQSEVTPIASILIDTQSQFWTLKFAPNPKVQANKDQLRELEKWNIKENKLLDCHLFIPKGSQRITGDETEFTLNASDVEHDEWCALIGEDLYSPQGYVLGRALEELEGRAFGIEDLLQAINAGTNWHGVADVSRHAVLYKLDGYRRSGLFSKSGLSIRDLLRPGRCNVFLLRDLKNEDKALVTGLIARQLFTVMGEHHKARKTAQFFDRKIGAEMLPSRVWLLIDEAHVVAPAGSRSPATSSLIEYVKRGRDAGLSLVLATQQPSAVDDRILSQVNVSLSHRLSFASDVQASINRIPTKLLSGMKIGGIEIQSFGDMMRHLDSGQCFIGDHNTSRTVLLKIRPRVTSHGGYSPI